MRERDIDPDAENREQALRAREDAIAERERRVCSSEAREGEEQAAWLVERAQLQDELTSARQGLEQTRAERERLLSQMREANENLVIASLHADELAERADEGRRRAETLAAQLAASEAIMRDSEDQFRTMANTVPMLAWSANADGSIAWFNDRWYEYTGKTFEDQVGWQWESVHDPADLPRVLAGWRVAIANGEPWEDTFRLRRHDGELRWFLARAMPLRDAGHHHTVRWFGTSVDIDAQKRAEVEVRAASRAKDEFLAILGHELRNPLAPILTALDLLKMNRAFSPPREVAIIERQVRHMVRLVDDLLDVSRITGGKVSLAFEPMELADVITHAVEMVSPLVEATEQKLSVSVAAAGLLVRGDPVRLSQIVTNVLTNAAKYTPSRGAIAVAAERQGSTVLLRIRDSGIGISSEMLPRVFSLFAQEHQPLDRARGGLGLGLAIVRSLVEMHGGRVSAHSDGLGKGSEFVIELPLHEPGEVSHPGGETDLQHPALVSGRQLAEPDTLGEARSILVVDDNQDAAELLAEVLAAHGHEVRVALDGRAALALVDEFDPDVAVLDIGLPVMDGYELAHRLLERLAPRRPGLIALTGYGQDRDRRRARESGFDFHLVKPVDANHLQDAIGQVSRRKAAS